MAKGTLVFEDGTIYRVDFEPVPLSQREVSPTPQGTQGRITATEATKSPDAALPNPHPFNPGDSVACRTCGLDYYAHNAKENR